MTGFDGIKALRRIEKRLDDAIRKFVPLIILFGFGYFLGEIPIRVRTLEQQSCRITVDKYNGDLTFYVTEDDHGTWKTALDENLIECSVYPAGGLVDPGTYERTRDQ